MNAFYASLSALSLVLALTIFGANFDPPLLTITARRQLDNWKPLLNAFREAPSTNSTDLRSSALKLAWCDAPLPPQTVRAPYCACVDRVYTKFSNYSQASLASARDEAVMGLVSCLSNRPVWKVSPVWGVRFTTPAVYILFVVASSLWLASDVPSRTVILPLAFFAALVSILLMVQDYIHNSFWIFVFILVPLFIGYIIRPGFEPDKRAEHNLDLVASAFWWCEYLSCPVFAAYVPLMHCGRDIFFVSVFTMIGTAIGGLGLRSFWCSQMYRKQSDNDPKSQFMSVMQYIVWLGILASCVSLSFLTGIYYNPDTPYAMGPGSVALLALTFVISMLQWPGYHQYDQVLITQQSLSLVRVVVFYILILMDLVR